VFGHTLYYSEEMFGQYICVNGTKIYVEGKSFEDIRMEITEVAKAKLKSEDFTETKKKLNEIMERYHNAL
tara:strand:+ start:1802 stop:2011 length:210 start_codon:yes stop_codon:yes gene_type:complete